MFTYSESEKARRSERQDQDDSSHRSPFARDRDRILYSSAFRVLAGKTQVVSTHELGRFHTRLTHSLKVAQLGRVLAARLAGNDGEGPDPDLVEAACLAHDIGHPPFGHAGEDELCRAMDKFKDAQVKSDNDHLGDGFEGNAQTFRVVTYLAPKDQRNARRNGLDLTRATLRAIAKYPWKRGYSGHSSKWSAYSLDSEALDWMLEGRKNALVPVEEQIMDWCDDVTYACHDMEDFYRSSFIPLASLFRNEPAGGRSQRENFLEWIGSEDGWDEIKNGKHTHHEVDRALDELKKYVHVDCPFNLRRETEYNLGRTISDLITYFMSNARLSPRSTCSSRHGYDAKLDVPAEVRFHCNVLKQFAWCYVIKKRNLLAQQQGQRRIVRDLLKWHYETPELLPRNRQEELDDHHDLLRAACDHVAGLTEIRAYELHRRLSGEQLGAITDLI